MVARVAVVARIAVVHSLLDSQINNHNESLQATRIVVTCNQLQ